MSFSAYDFRLEFAIFDRREIFLEAVFLWITPFFALLAITDLA